MRVKGQTGVFFGGSRVSVLIMAALFALAFCAALAPNAQAAFPATAETFEAGWGAWTSESGVWDVGTPDPSYTNGPAAAHSGTKCAGTVLNGPYPTLIGDRLISPTLTLPTVSGTGQVLLRFWQWFKYTTYGRGHVEVREWSGTAWGSWSRMWSPGGDNRDVPQWLQVAVDVTAYAGKQVQISFWHEPYAAYWGDTSVNAGWYIDDVEITTRTATWDGSLVTFEGGWSNWYSDVGVWQVGGLDGSYANGPSSAHGGTQCAGTILNGDYPWLWSDRLVSPPVMLPTVNGPEQLYLRYWQWFRYTTYGQGRVEVREWSGTAWGSWTNLGILAGPGTDSAMWLRPTINFTAYAGKQVQISFWHEPYAAYWGDTSVNAGWYIDDIVFSIPGRVYALDVQSTPPTGVAITSTTGHGGTTNYQVANVAHFATVDLTAPDGDPAGYTFVKWTVNGVDQPAGQKTTSFTMTGATTAVAAYRLSAFTLTVQSTPPTGVAITSTTGHGGTTNYQKTLVPYGTSVALTAPATDPTGYNFVKWTVDGIDQPASQKTITFSLTGATTVVAVYQPGVYTLTVQSTPPTGVAVTSTTGHGGTTNYQKTGVAYNTIVNLSAPATDPAGYTFSKWRKNSVDQPAGRRTLDFTLTGTTTAVAVYQPKTYTLTVQSTPPTGLAISSTTGHGGTTNYQKTGVAHNAAVHLKAPDSDPTGYTFARWTLNGAAQPAGAKEVTTAMTGARTAVAVYDLTATEFYVNDGVTGEALSRCTAAGDDANDGLSPATPMRTIAGLLGKYPALGTGKTVLVDPGTYVENIGIDSAKNGLTLQGAGAAATVIGGNPHGGPVLGLYEFTGTVRGVTLTGGDAPRGGGIYAYRSDFTLADCDVRGNTAPEGGGIYNDSSSPTITGCRFRQNNGGYGDTYGGGGGMYNNLGSNPAVMNTTFESNQAYCGGGVYNDRNSSPLFVNCLFTGNSVSQHGGAMINLWWCCPALVNCTLTGNQGGAFGGGLDNYLSWPVVENSILSGNTAHTGPEVTNCDTSTPLFRHSLVSGCAGSGARWNAQMGQDGGGNLDGDPRFVTGFQLGANSPCIDAADGLTAPALDLAGQARRDDVGAPNLGLGGPWADMGAFEFQGTSILPAGFYVNDAVLGEPGSLCTGPGDDAHDGLSPVRPMRTIQALLNKYPAIGSQKTLWVDPGLYPEVVNVTGHSGLKIRGAGPDKCVVDGGQVNTVFVLNSFGAGELSGLTIRNGKATGATALEKSGGGIRVVGASTALIANCIIKSNATGTGSGGGGIYTYNASPSIRSCLVANNTGTGCGGIRTYNGAVTITNCTVANNTGGGIHKTGTGTLAITNSIVWGNGDDLNACAATYSCIEDADAGTGNIAADPLFINSAVGDYRLTAASPCIDAANSAAAPTRDIAGSPRMDDPGVLPNGSAFADIGAYEFAGVTQNAVVYVNNAAFNEAGSLCTAPGNDANSGFSPRAPMATIQGALNKYPAYGAGKTIWVDPGTFAENVNIVATHAGLKIQGAGAGKAIVDGGQLNTVIIATNFGAGEISGLTLQNGKATGATAIEKSGGGIRLYGASTALIANCILKNNAAGIGSGGGGIYTYNASPTIRNCVVVKNTGTGCGGIRTFGGAVSIMNCTVAYNTGGGIHRTGTGTLTITNTIAWENGDDLMSCTATYSCIQDGDAGTGNISGNPLFLNAAAGDYHLTFGSPCIDAGTPTGAPATDLDGIARDATPDIGAYEYES
jgi:hypothetical protein